MSTVLNEQDHDDGDEPEDFVERRVVVGHTYREGPLEHSATAVSDTEEEVSGPAQVLPNGVATKSPDELADCKAKRGAIKQVERSPARPFAQHERGSNESRDDAATELQPAIPDRECLKWVGELLQMSEHEEQASANESDDDQDHRDLLGLGPRDAKSFVAPCSHVDTQNDAERDEEAE